MDYKELKKKFNYIFDNYSSHIIWFLLAFQAIVVAITSYN